MYVDSVIRSSYNIPCRLVIVANLRGGERFLCEFSNLDVYIARLHAAVLNLAGLSSRRRSLALACAPHRLSPACAPPTTLPMLPLPPQLPLARCAADPGRSHTHQLCILFVCRFVLGGFMILFIMSNVYKYSCSPPTMYMIGFQ